MIYYSILLIILLSAGITDIKHLKIPNYITFPGMLLGLFLGPLDSHILLWKLFGWVLLFLLGMTRLVGMGDLKLIMVINCFLTFYPSLFCTGIAAGLLLITSLIRKPKETVGVAKTTLFQLYLGTFNKIDEEGYPFAPFLFVGTGIYLLFTTL